MSANGQPQSELALAPFTLRDLLLYFLRLGTLGFGGPIALAGYMQRDLVETRRILRGNMAMPLFSAAGPFSVINRKRRKSEVSTSSGKITLPSKAVTVA
jgi:hypothetical protein